MAFYLHYGNDEIQLEDDVDTAELLKGFAVGADHSGIADIAVHGGRASFVVTAHIPVWVEERHSGAYIF